MARQTYGGRLLRRLRDQCGYTQDEVYEGAYVAQKTLSNIETGTTQIPDRDTIQSLLDFYEATFNDRYEVFQAFGHLPDARYLPTEEELADIAAQVQPVLDATPVPGYAVDFMARMVGANRLWITLFQLDAEAMQILRTKPFWQASLESDTPSDGVLDATIVGEVRQLRQQMTLFVDEPWFDRFLEERGDLFLRYWQAAGQVQQSGALSTEIPVLKSFSIALPNSPLLGEFFYSEKLLNHDRRFRLVYVLPANIASWQWVEARKSGIKSQ